MHFIKVLGRISKIKFSKKRGKLNNQRSAQPPIDFMTNSIMILKRDTWKAKGKGITIKDNASH